jgi:hypothetical protein
MVPTEHIQDKLLQHALQPGVSSSAAAAASAVAASAAAALSAKEKDALAIEVNARRTASWIHIEYQTRTTSS